MPRMERLKQYLEDQNISQTEFGRRVSVSQPTVSGWLRGEILPSAEKLKEISNKTALSIDALLDHTPPRKAPKAAATHKVG